MPIKYINIVDNISGDTLGALIKDQAVSPEQPDGTEIALLASGDEFYNYLQDMAGYTVVQNPETGYYVYAIEQGSVLTASQYNVQENDPALLETVKFLLCIYPR